MTRPAGDVRVWPVERDVSAVVPIDGEHVMRGSLYASAGIDPGAPPVVVFALAGGRVTTRYFDLEVDGDDSYSMARHLAARGLVVITLDHLGIGGSTPLDDLCVITPEVAAATHADAVGAMIAQLRGGTLVAELPAFEPAAVIGLGHSMGGMVIVVEQAKHGLFDAIVVLGHSGDGTWEALTDDERLLMQVPVERRERAMVDLARVRAGGLPPETARRAAPGSFFLPDVPRPVKAAFAAERTELLYSCALSTMIPGHTDAEKAAVTVPVFLAFGDHDLTDDYDGNAARYASCPDLTLCILEGSAHCHNQATTRAVLWDRVVEWIVSAPW